MYTKNMEKTDFQIIYDGKALQTHEMDVKELAPALLAVGELLEESNAVLFGEKSKVYVNVKGSFKTGSFHIDFTTAQSFVDGLVDIFNNQSPALQILILLGVVRSSVDGVEAVIKIGDGVQYVSRGLLQFILWVKNRNIVKISRSSEKGTVFVEVEDGEKIATKDSVITLYRNIKIRSAFDTIINKILSKDGIDTFAIGQEKTLTKVKKDEKEYFATPHVSEEIVEDQTIETTLQEITVSFEEGYKWRFTDGESAFTATVKDEDFMEKVKNNKIAFSKGDALKVKLHKVVLLTETGLKPEYEILEIVKHYQVGKQIKLPFVNSEKDKKQEQKKGK